MTADEERRLAVCADMVEEIARRLGVELPPRHDRRPRLTLIKGGS